MKDDEMERARECLAEIAGAAVLDTNADGYYHVSVCLRAMLAFAQQPEGWREALEKISALTVVPISEDHAAANNGKEVIRAKSIARRALAPAAMLDAAPIPGEE